MRPNSAIVDAISLGMRSTLHCEYSCGMNYALKVERIAEYITEYT